MSGAIPAVAHILLDEPAKGLTVEAARPIDFRRSIVEGGTWIE